MAESDRGNKLSMRSNASTVTATSVVYALALYAATIPLEPVFRLGAAGSITRVAGYGVLAAFALTLTQGSGFGNPSVLKWGAAFVGWSALSVLWTVDVGDGTSRVITLLAILAVTYVMSTQVRRTQDFLVVSAGFIVGLHVSAVLTLSRLGEAIRSEEVTRLAPDGFDVNEYGVTVVIGMALALVVARLEPPSWLLWISRATYVIGPLLVFLTGSRGAFLTLTAVAIVAAVGARSRGWKPLAGFVAVSAIGLILALNLTPETSRSRIELFFSDETRAADQSIANRAELLALGLEVTLDRPATGFGLASFPHVSESRGDGFHVAHNTWVSVASELGIVGLFFYVAMHVAVIGATRRRALPLLLPVSAMLLASVVASSSLTLEYKKPPWFVIGMALAAVAVFSEHTGLTPARRDLSSQGTDREIGALR